MPTFTLRGRITPDRRLELQLPPEAPEGEAEVTVTVSVEDKSVPPFTNSGKILAFLEELHANPHHTYRTKAEIDRYLKEERDSWGDD